MSVPRLAGKRDTAHSDIRDGLRKRGYLVLDLGGVGGGCPDLLVAKDGYMWLLEVKTGNSPLRPSQLKFHAKWREFVQVVRSLDEALLVCSI